MPFALSGFVTNSANTALDRSPEESQLPMTATLPTSAECAYRIFVETMLSDWMPVVSSCQVLRADECGRADITAILIRFQRATLGLTLHFTYNDEERIASWTTGPDSSTQIRGSVRFQSLGKNASMIHYELDVDLHASVPDWDEGMYNSHFESAFLSDFRDYLSRTKGTLWSIPT